MKIIVQKYGGSIIRSPKDILSIVDCIVKEKQNNSKVVVVVSAIKKFTDELISYAHCCCPGLKINNLPEYDFLLSSGEQISAGLFAFSLRKKKINAEPLNAYSLIINTDSNYGSATIKSIDYKIIMNLLNKDIVPIITGFQGFDGKKITTIGRGGSDTTAVAIATAINADLCQIFTDVDGVYTCDPKLSKKASFIPYLSYKNALLLSAKGFKILNYDAVKIAYLNNIKIQILSNDKSKGGTNIMSDKDNTLCNFTDVVINNIVTSELMTLVSTLGVPVENLIFDNITDNNFYCLSSSIDKNIFLVKKEKNGIDFLKNYTILAEDVLMVSLIGNFNKQHYEKIIKFIKFNNIKLHFLSFVDFQTLSIVIDYNYISFLLDNIYNVFEELQLN